MKSNSLARMGSNATPDATPEGQIKKRGPKRPYPPRQEKPYSDFPLSWHLRGYWFKKVDGRHVPYTADWKQSLKMWEADDAARQRGESLPSLAPRGFTVADAINLFMHRQAERFAQGEIGEVQLAKYRIETEKFGDVLGLETRLARLCGDDGPALFRKLRDKRLEKGVVVAERHVYYVRKMLELAQKRGLMGTPNYLDSFEKPSAKLVAKAKLAERSKFGERAWSVEELRVIVTYLSLHSPRMLAMGLLALNAGFGADDCALLEQRMIDRRLGLIRGAYRGKNLRQRVSPLWPVTLWAIDRAAETRAAPAAPELAGRVFLTDNGLPVARRTVKRDEDGDVKRTGRVDAVQQSFDRVIDRIEREQRIEIRRHKAGFYTLRAMFRTLAVGAGVDNDLIAVIKGQKFERPVDEYYLRGDLREKLFKVTDHVFSQLFAGWSEPWPWCETWPRQPQPGLTYAPSPS